MTNPAASKIKCSYCGRLIERCPVAHEPQVVCRGWRHKADRYHACGTVRAHEQAMPAPGAST